jgi:hypothetical protein
MTTGVVERDEHEESDEGLPGRGRARALQAALVATLVLPIVAGTIAALFLDAHPVMDWALIELRVRDVGTSQMPLLGPFSRFGWNHPGPLLFWLLAVPYRVLGSSSDAMFVGAGIVNLAAAAGIAWVTVRRGGLALLAWTVLVFTALLRGQEALFVVDPWNPTIVVLPFALLAFLTWSIGEGDHRLMPLWVLVASWIVQSHLGFVPLVGAFGLWGLGWLLFRHRSRDTIRWLLGAVALAAVLWLPPVVEQLTEDPGNVEQIARHYLGDREGREVADPNWNKLTGVDKATEVYGRHLAVNGVWAGGDESTDLFTGELLGSASWGAAPLLVAFAGATAFAWHRRRGDAVRLAGLVALGLGVGFVAAARIDGYAFPYLFGWLEVLAALAWLSIGWSLLRALPGETRPTVTRIAIPVAAAAAVVLSLVATANIVADLEPPLPKADAAVAAVGPPTVDSTRGSTVLVVNTGTCLNEVGYGVALQLDRHGIDVLVSEDQENRFGEKRIWDGANADLQATVACREAVPEALDLAERDPDVEVVASWDPVPPELAASEDEIDEAIADALRDLGREDLLPDIESGWILFSGPGAGVGEDVLGPYRELVQKTAERVVVVVGPAPA